MLDEQTSFVEDQWEGLAICRAGNASGKSEAGAYKLAKYLRTVPPSRPSMPVWVVAPNYELACGVCWTEKLAKYIPQDQIEHIRWYSKGAGWAQTVVLKKWPNGNNYLIEMKSSEQGREKFTAASIAFAWFDEWCDLGIIREVWSRMRDVGVRGNLAYTLTPKKPDPELREIYYNPKAHPYIKWYRLNTRLNAALAEGFVEQRLASECEQLRETVATGEWAMFEGAVFREFDYSRHVIKPFEIEPHWFRFRGMDIGFADAHPFAVIWVAQDGDRYYVYHEYEKAQQNLQHHVLEVQKIPWPYDRHHGPTYADQQAAVARNELSSMYNFATEVSVKDILCGIAWVQKLFREDRLFIFDTCHKLLSEIQGYTWHERLDKPNKLNDDLVDALRYALTSHAVATGNWTTWRKDAKKMR